MIHSSNLMNKFSAACASRVLLQIMITIYNSLSRDCARSDWICHQLPRSTLIFARSMTLSACQVNPARSSPVQSGPSRPVSSWTVGDDNKVLRCPSSDVKRPHALFRARQETRVPFRVNSRRSVTMVLLPWYPISLCLLFTSPVARRRKRLAKSSNS